MDRQILRIQEEEGLCFLNRPLYCCESKITLFTYGEGILDTRTGILPVTSGDIVFMSGYQPHTYRYTFDSHLKGLSIYFNSSRSPSALFSVPEIRKIADMMSHYSNGFKISCRGSAAIAERFLAAKAEQGLQLLIRFLELLRELYCCRDIVSLVPEKSNNPQYEEDRIRRVVDHIYQNFNRSISLSEMAEITHLTKESFCRYFKQHTGRNMADFVNEVRIGEVCNRLCTSKMPVIISDAAYECGFRNMSHFNKTFRVLMGVTPNQYIQSKSRAMVL